MDRRDFSHVTNEKLDVALLSKDGCETKKLVP